MKDDAAAFRERARFADRLRSLRGAHGDRIGRPGLSQKDFAGQLGIEGERYRRYERGETEPPLWLLATIKRVTGTRLDDLVGEPLPHGPPAARLPRNFGARLQTARLALGLSVVEAAMTAGLPAAAITSFEDESVVPDTQSLLAISERLHVPMDFIMTGDFTALTGRMLQRIVDLALHPDAPLPAKEIRASLPETVPVPRHTLHEDQPPLRRHTVHLPD